VALSRFATCVGSAPAVARPFCARACRNPHAARVGPPWRGEPRGAPRPLPSPKSAPCPPQATWLARCPAAERMRVAALEYRAAHPEHRAVLRARDAEAAARGAAAPAAAFAPRQGPLTSDWSRLVNMTQPGHNVAMRWAVRPQPRHPPPWPAGSLGGPSSPLPCKHTSWRFADRSPLPQPQARLSCVEAVWLPEQP